MEPNRIRELLLKYYNSETTLAEEHELKKSLAEDSDIPSEFIAQKGLFSYFLEARKIKTLLNRRLISLLAAASILILAGVFISNKYLEINNSVWSKELVTYINETGKIQKITLADENIVWLNGNSELIYPKRLAENNNDFTVKGEVYFEILHRTSTYSITANQALIRAEVFSSFNIKALDGTPSTEIAVDSGAVKIYQGTDSGSMAMIIRSGYYCSVHNSQKFAFISAITDANYKSWKTHEFNFSNTPMATVVNVLTKYYNVPIELENKQMGFCGFSGTFKEKSLDEILDKIQTELNYTITNTGDAILLSGRDCL